MSVFVNKETTYLLTLITMQNLTAVCVDMCRGPKIGGNGARPFGGGDIDPQNTRFFLRCVTMLNLIVLGQRIWIRQKKVGPCVSSFKVTQGHRNRHGPMGYPCLPISGQNNRPVLYHFRDKRRFRSKNANFHYPLVVFMTRCFYQTVEKVSRLVHSFKHNTTT